MNYMYLHDNEVGFAPVSLITKERGKLMDNLKNILVKLPGEIGSQMRALPDNVVNHMEEIRIKVGKPIYIYSGGREYVLAAEEKGNVNTESIEKPRDHFGKQGNSLHKNIIGNEMMVNIFNNILKYSAYAFQEDIAKGYVTIDGGHRVGICGKAVMEKGKVRILKDISSINIRRSREIIGVADPYIKYLLRNRNQAYNILIVSPPKCGKTTLLRDLIRSFSSIGFKVGLCDERSEISGIYNGSPSYDLGDRTDILDGCPKEEGMMMLIRSMSPDIIATDEIGKKEDVYALEAALCAGISVLTTIHGNSYEDLLRSGIGDLIQKGFFERLIYLSNTPSTGNVTCIKNGEGKLLC